jgi:hypothetical protein
MKGGFIKVQKISEVLKKDHNGQTVINPMTKKPFVDDFELNIEVISIEEIKSSREWRKSRSQGEAFKGDITMIYFKSQNERIKLDRNTGVEKNSAPGMLINEPIDSFSKRIGAIELP